MMGEPVETDSRGTADTSAAPSSHAGASANGAAPGQMPCHILLVGFMGSGKSTAARRLARLYGKVSFDMDMGISRTAGKSIPEIFEDEGEQGFRRREREYLEYLRTVEPAIVSCGGGIVTIPENRKTLKELGFVVFLDVDPQEAVSRIGSPESRPILAGGADPAALLAERMPMYLEVADMRFETTGKTPAQVAMELGEELESRGLL